ncbi:hypothetical protein Tco_1314741 [Tanacetum coccineum]
MATEPNEVRKETLRRLRQELVADVELANNLLHELNRYLEQLHTRAPELLRVEALPDDPLIKYGFSALERAAYSDMTNSANLVSTRTELLRTITDKQQMISRYKNIHYSIFITSGPEVAFVTLAASADHSNIEWYFKHFPNREIGSPLPNVGGLCLCVLKTLEGVLARFRIRKVWRNPLCDPVIRHRDGTVMSIYDFIGMPSLNGAKVREEAHNLGTPLLGRFVDHTTTPALTGTAIPSATLEEIVVTQPDRGVVTKAKNAAKQKASTRLEVSTNVTKKTKSANIGSATDDFEHSDDIGQGANGDTHHRVEEDVHALDTSGDAPVSHVTKPKDTDFGVDETEHEEDGYIGFDGGDKDLADGYYMPYPYDEGSSDSPPYTREEWDGVRTMNLGLLNKEFFKDPKLMSHVGEVSARYDHVVRNVNRLSKRCAQQTLSFKQQSDDLRQVDLPIRNIGSLKRRGLQRNSLQQQKAKVDEELMKAKSQFLEKQAKESQSDVTSFFQSDFVSLFRRFLKSGEFNRAFGDVISLAMSVGVEQGLCMACTDTQFQELSYRVSNFVPNAREKFDDVLEPDPAVPFSKTSSTTVSLGVRTRDRSSAPSTETFGHTSTPEHLKRKKPSGSGASSAV